MIRTILVFGCFLVSGCTSTPKGSPPSSNLRRLDGEDAKRVAELQPAVDLRKEACREWTKNWEPIWARVDPRDGPPKVLSLSDRKAIEVHLSAYPRAIPESSAMYAIYFNHRSELDQKVPPVFHWLESVLAFPNCSIGRYWNGMKRLIEEPRKPDARSDARLRELLRESFPTLLGADGFGGQEIEFRIVAGLFERATEMKKIELPGAALGELSRAKTRERGLTEDFRKREAVFGNVLGEIGLDANGNLDLSKGRLENSLEAYREWGRATFAERESLVAGPFADLKEWYFRWIRGL